MMALWLGRLRYLLAGRGKHRRRRHTVRADVPYIGPEQYLQYKNNFSWRVKNRIG